MPTTLSPGESAGWRDSTTSPTVPPIITAPSACGCGVALAVVHAHAHVGVQAQVVVAHQHLAVLQRGRVGGFEPEVVGRGFALPGGGEQDLAVDGFMLSW
jgi:hypothetical protein